MRVMQVKHNSRLKNKQVNSRGLFSLAVTRGNQGGCNSSPVYYKQSGPTNMCAEYNYVPKAPSHQQSYGLYLKRATMGVGSGGGGIGLQASGGLASRVVNISFVDVSFNRGRQQRMLTYKRAQSGGVDGFSSSNYIDNVRSKALRCDQYVDKTIDPSGCKPAVEPICYNSCSKKPIITKNLGYISASQQINKKLSLRAGTSVNTNYERNIMNSSSDGTCG